MLGRLLSALAPYSPTIAGTFPLGLQVDGSDLDILCCADDLDAFEATLRSVVDVPSQRIGGASVTAFELDGLPIEVYCTSTSVYAQNGFRHMIEEGRRLIAGGEALAEQIRAKKRLGIKTEPAFAQALGLPGDPYRAMLGELPIARFDGDREALRPLLRLADDSEAAIDGYIAIGTVLVLEGLRGHALLAEIEPGVVEIKTVAVVPELRGSGHGARLMRAAIDEARRMGANRVCVATATAGTDLLRFYQRLGFRFARIVRDVFTVDNGYPAGIEEGGVPIRDQVWLDLAL